MGSAPPSPAGEQKDGTWGGGKQGLICVQNTGLACQGSTSGGCTHLTPSAGHDPPTPICPHQELWIIFAVSVTDKTQVPPQQGGREAPSPWHCPRRLAGRPRPVGALGVVPHLWVPEAFALIPAASLLPAVPHGAGQGWCHLPRPYFPVGARGRPGSAVVPRAGEPPSWRRGQGVRAPARRVGKDGWRSLPSGPPYSSAVAMALPRCCQVGGGGGGGLCLSPLGSLQVGRCPRCGRPGCLTLLSDIGGENGLFRVKCPQRVEL